MGIGFGWAGFGLFNEYIVACDTCKTGIKVPI